MTTVFKTKLVNELGTTPETVLTSSPSATTTVIGLSLANLTQSIILASVRLHDTVNDTMAYYSKDIIIPPNQSLRVVNGGERLVVGPSTALIVSANTEASIDLVLSYVEIS